MPIDASLSGQTFGPTDPYLVTEDAVTSFAAAVGTDIEGVPPTFPIVVTFQAMLGFLDDQGLELSRIIHGDQKFHYERPLRIGDELTATMTVTGVRQIGGNDIISTTSELTDSTDSTVCTASATLIHRGGEV